MVNMKKVQSALLEAVVLERDALGNPVKLLIDDRIYTYRRPNQVLRKPKINSLEMTDRGIHIVEGGR